MTEHSQAFEDFVRSHDPLVTAVVPSYNKASFLPETIQSILDQEYRNIEVLVVNDGSPDNTAQTVSEIAAANPDRIIRHIEKPNGGISDARNFGITQAHGRLILALDGDDQMKPSFVSKAIAAMRQTGANLVTCTVELFGTQSGIWVPNQYEQFSIRYDNSIPTLVLFDRWLWEQVGGYKVDFPFVEDWDFFVGCSDRGMRVCRIDEPLFRYRASESGLAHIFTDCYKWCLALIMTSRQELYPVDEVVWAHDHLKTMPERWFEKFKSQSALHNSAWLLHFWLGLYAEGRGEIELALKRYSQALQASGATNWQAIYQLGRLFVIHNINVGTGFELLHRVRILRPDMRSFVEKSLEAQKAAQQKPAN